MSDSDQIKRAKLAAMTAMGQAKPSRSLAAAMRRMDKALEKKDPRP